MLKRLPRDKVTLVSLPPEAFIGESVGGIHTKPRPVSLLAPGRKYRGAPGHPLSSLEFSKAGAWGFGRIPARDTSDLSGHRVTNASPERVHVPFASLSMVHAAAALTLCDLTEKGLVSPQLCQHPRQLEPRFRDCLVTGGGTRHGAVDGSSVHDELPRRGVRVKGRPRASQPSPRGCVSRRHRAGRRRDDGDENATEGHASWTRCRRRRPRSDRRRATRRVPRRVNVDASQRPITREHQGGA